MSILHSRAGDDAATDEKLRTAGLDATFTCFVHEHHLTVKRFLRRLEADGGMVEDVSQEALMAVREKWADVQGYRDPRAWTLRVARNILRDHQRTRGRRRVLFFDDLSMPELPAPTDPEEADERLAGWIQLLPTRMGEVMSMSLAGLPDRTIALELGISYNTVRDTKKKAREKLQQLAEADGFITPAGRRRT
ncbi:RNA polymerase sigma factor [Actinoplanes sp. NPDC049668]|uniref:RNA polymerase sigma factor n=1 Tax=unclassified Actinoplanes TaxID=2626549 RepID=UPI0033BBC0AF